MCTAWPALRPARERRRWERKRTVASFWNRTQWPKVCANGWTRLARARSVAGQPPSTHGCLDLLLLPAVLPRGISRALRHHGYEVVADPESFIVTKQNTLEPGEEDRARTWGARLAAILAATATPARGG